MVTVYYMYEIHHNSIIDLFHKDCLGLKCGFCQLILCQSSGLGA